MSNHYTQPLTKTQVKMYEIIHDNPGISYRQLARQIGVTSASVQIMVTSLETHGILLAEDKNCVSLYQEG